MCIIFGIRKPRRQTVEERQLLDLAHATDKYAPDGTFVRSNGGLGMGFQPYHTHQRSQLESQPAADERGNMLAFDGRLDNHKELCELLDIQENEISDSMIVLAAFECWGEDCFSRFIGDWALALWSQRDRSLYLGRDHAGTRTLYFEQAEGRILWSTSLETFFTEGKMRDLDKGFAACYLSCQPIRELTPYEGIQSVPPAHYLVFHEGNLTCKSHWQWTVKNKIRYKTEAEYEERFFTLFRQSVERRTGPGAAILAQLSGGMDSSSIVCMSDHIRRERGAAHEELLDTVSYYDDSDPAWNEMPYFSCVEQARQKTGIHIDASSMSWSIDPSSQFDEGLLVPGANNQLLNYNYASTQSGHAKEYRVILSGIGGDELLGGVPIGVPELADYLATGKFYQLIERSISWCLPSRSPLFHSLFNTINFTCHQYFRHRPDISTLPSWFTPYLHSLCRHRHSHDISNDCSSLSLPGAISNGKAWWSILEAQPHLIPAPHVRYEYRYPYLDKNLVEFLLGIPRSQLVAPGRRRYLMRRSLAHIVPTAIRERRRKAYLTRAPLRALQNAADDIHSIVESLYTAQCGLVDPSSVQKATELITAGINITDWPYLGRLIKFELWLRAARISKICDTSRHRLKTVSLPIMEASGVSADHC